MKTPTILVSRCYAETTPESVENGDFSDTGFVYQSQPFTFRELVQEIERGGFAVEVGTDWLCTGWSTEDYRTCTEREETLHFDRSNPAHLEKWFWLAAKYVKAKRDRRMAKYLTR